MYNFIFYTLYKYNLKDGPRLAKINACAIVALALLIHVLFFYAAIKKIAPDFYRTILENSLPHDKILRTVLVLIIGLCVFFWYNRPRVKKLLSKRKVIPEHVSYDWDIIYVVLLLLIPLIPIIIIFWKG